MLIRVGLAALIAVLLFGAGYLARDLPARGAIAGHPFVVEKATMKEGGILELREGEDFFADRSITVFIFEIEAGETPDDSPEGKKMALTQNETQQLYAALGWAAATHKELLQPVNRYPPQWVLTKEGELMEPAFQSATFKRSKHFAAANSSGYLKDRSRDGFDGEPVA